MINKLEKYLYDCIHFTTDNINNYLKENYNNFNILIIDNNSIENDKDLFNSIANVMKFPDYFGKNWDALDECLRDLDWLELKEGLILVILNSKKIWQRCPMTAGKLIESWLTVVDYWSKEKVPFHLFFSEMEIDKL